MRHDNFVFFSFTHPSILGPQVEGLDLEPKHSDAWRIFVPVFFVNRETWQKDGCGL